ncbi:MAG: hypothetical protein ACOYNP_11225 [Gemmataceae bacterium]
MSMATTLKDLDPVSVRSAIEYLKQAGNPFRNHFARNADDEACGRFHVPELYARERTMLLALIEQFREKPGEDAGLLPVLGNKGSGKTHLLHTIKHGAGGRQIIVTPGTYQRDTDFLEYMLFQVIDTLLGGGRQGKTRPLHVVGLDVACRSLSAALASLPSSERIQLFPPPFLGGLLGKLGLGHDQAREKCSWLISKLENSHEFESANDLLDLCDEAGLDAQRACDLASSHAANSMGRATQGLMIASVIKGFCHAIFLGDESELSSFLTFGFAEIEFHVRPSRADLVLSLFRALMEIMRKARVPVVIAFDQLEDLLLARRGEDSFRIAESFFAGIVQSLHQVPGLGFLLFAERGLWNRFVPSLDGYMRDRLTNPVHLPGLGTVQAIRLDPPQPILVRLVVEARLRSTHAAHACFTGLPACFPLDPEQVDRVARTESTLRDMLQQFRAMFDAAVYGEQVAVAAPEAPTTENPTPVVLNRLLPRTSVRETELAQAMPDVVVKSVVEVAVNTAPTGAANSSQDNPDLTSRLIELWDLELASARRQLSPDGALCGATREIQSGLGFLLRLINERGIRVGPWRLQHVVESFDYGDHPVYGVVSLGHWASLTGSPWKVGVGLFLGRGQGKLKDLSVKLASLDFDPALVDHLILLRPDDDLILTGKSRQLWQDAERRGKHARIESIDLDGFASLYALPRVHATAIETSDPEQVRHHLASLLHDKADRLLRQVCMPVQDI